MAKWNANEGIIQGWNWCVGVYGRHPAWLVLLRVIAVRRRTVHDWDPASEQRKRRQHSNAALYPIQQLETFFRNAANSGENDVAIQGLVWFWVLWLQCSVHEWRNGWIKELFVKEKPWPLYIHVSLTARCGQRTWIIYFYICSSISAELYPLCEHRSSVGHENSRDKRGAIRHQETVQVCRLELE